MTPTTIDEQVEILRALSEQLTNDPAQLCDFEGCDEDATNKLICPEKVHKGGHIGENVCAGHTAWLYHEAGRDPESRILFSKTCSHDALLRDCLLRPIK